MLFWLYRRILTPAVAIFCFRKFIIRMVTQFITPIHTSLFFSPSFVLQDRTYVILLRYASTSSRCSLSFFSSMALSSMILSYLLTSNGIQPVIAICDVATCNVLNHIIDFACFSLHYPVVT